MGALAILVVYCHTNFWILLEMIHDFVKVDVSIVDNDHRVRLLVEEMSGENLFNFVAVGWLKGLDQWVEERDQCRRRRQYTRYWSLSRHQSSTEQRLQWTTPALSLCAASRAKTSGTRWTDPPAPSTSRCRDKNRDIFLLLRIWRLLMKLGFALLSHWCIETCLGRSYISSGSLFFATLLLCRPQDRFPASRWLPRPWREIQGMNGETLKENARES